MFKVLVSVSISLLLSLQSYAQTSKPAKTKRPLNWSHYKIQTANTFMIKRFKTLGGFIDYVMKTEKDVNHKRRLLSLKRKVGKEKVPQIKMNSESKIEIMDNNKKPLPISIVDGHFLYRGKKMEVLHEKNLIANFDSLLKQMKKIDKQYGENSLNLESFLISEAYAFQNDPTRELKRFSFLLKGLAVMVVGMIAVTTGIVTLPVAALMGAAAVLMLGVDQAIGQELGPAQFSCIGENQLSITNVNGDTQVLKFAGGQVQEMTVNGNTCQIGKRARNWGLFSNVFECRGENPFGDMSRRQQRLTLGDLDKTANVCATKESREAVAELSIESSVPSPGTQPSGTTI